MTTKQALSALTVSVKNDSLTNKMLFEMSILTRRHSLDANVGILRNKKNRFFEQGSITEPKGKP